MSTITVYTNVDIDIDDIIGDISTQDLTTELTRRKAEPIQTTIKSEKQLRMLIGKQLQLRECQINNEESFIKAIKEKLF